MKTRCSAGWWDRPSPEKGNQPKVAKMVTGSRADCSSGFPCTLARVKPSWHVQAHPSCWCARDGGEIDGAGTRRMPPLLAGASPSAPLRVLTVSRLAFVLRNNLADFCFTEAKCAHAVSGAGRVRRGRCSGWSGGAGVPSRGSADHRLPAAPRTRLPLASWPAQGELPGLSPCARRVCRLPVCPGCGASPALFAQCWRCVLWQAPRRIRWGVRVWRGGSSWG